MRNNYFLLGVLSLLAYGLQAGNVSVEKALKVATHYYGGLDHASLRSSPDATLTLAYAAMPDAPALRSSAETDAYYYVFNIGDDDGFIIVSGDDRAYPVLAYSFRGAFEVSGLPPNLEDWLKGYQEEVSFIVRENPDAPPAPGWEASENSASLLNDSPQHAVGPLGTAEWDQGSPYNDECPLFGNYLTLTGCVATAMAIVMKYHADHGFRAKGTGSHTYTWQGKKLSAAFGEYDWANMPLKTKDFVNDTQRAAVARLMYHCGVSIEAIYGTSLTFAYYSHVVRALLTFFGYDMKTENLRKWRFTDTEWAALIRKEIDNKRPVIYTGQREDSGHAFVCEGYNDKDEYYMNWGWGGYANGYFRLTALQPSINQNYIYDTGMIIGMQKAAVSSENFSGLRLTTSDGSMGMMKNKRVVRDEPFNVRTGVVENYSYTAFNGSVAVALMDNSGRLKEIVSNYEKGFILDPLAYTMLQFTCVATGSVAASDVLRFVCSEDNGQTWKIIYGGTGVTDVLGVNDAPSVFVEGVSLETSRTMTVGEIYQLKEQINPSDATNRNVSWWSDNTGVATVSSSGLVTATGTGTANIRVHTAEWGWWCVDTCEVRVLNPPVPVAGIRLNETQLAGKAGDAPFTLKATIDPGNATNKNIRWFTSNVRVATVKDGVVSFIGAGNAKITVTSIGSGKTASCEVTVADEATAIGETGSPAAHVSIENGLLSIYTSVSEQVEIYSIGGALLYQAQKPDGAATFDLSRLSRGLLIVRGSSGWTKKMIR